MEAPTLQTLSLFAAVLTPLLTLAALFGGGRRAIEGIENRLDNIEASLKGKADESDLHRVETSLNQLEGRVGEIGRSVARMNGLNKAIFDRSEKTKQQREDGNG